MAIYTDDDIEALMRERKRLPVNWQHRTSLKPKAGQRERQLDVDGNDGNRFRLILRQSRTNALDFSAVLAVLVPQST